ncbi:hypothetical protein BD560DRAFT_347885 [Blakeslea trispora]|nr:hypothetical protein BD560DRAFT_347885 [Blakeslea trispora]
MSSLPYYAQRQPPIPPNPILSNVRINKQIDMDHESQLKSLRSFVDLFSDTQPFWVEVAVLDRIHYKNMNQQRQFHRFKRGMELRRLIKRLKSLHLPKEMERLYLSFWNGASSDTSRPNYIPSKESVYYTLHRLISAALLLDKIKVVTLETFRANATLLKLEHFVSLAMVVMGICSRLYKLAHVWINQLEECYHLLYRWSACFPSGLKQKDQAAYDSQHKIACTADTFSIVRSQYTKTTQSQKASLQFPVHLESLIASQAVKEKLIETEPNDAYDEDEDLGEVIQR